jgi:hypothetical protein
MRVFISMGIVLALVMSFVSVALAKPIHEEVLISVSDPKKPVQLEGGKSIGQEFIAGKYFDQMIIYAPTWGKKDSGFTFTLRKNGINGGVVHTQKVENAKDGQTTFTFDAQAPGKYYAEMSKPVGPIGWWTREGNPYPDGTAFADGKAIDPEDRALVLQLIKEVPAETKPAPQRPIVKGDINVIINGQVQGYDQPPVIKDGRALVPLRGIFEALGTTVVWDQTAKTVTATRHETSILLKVGSKIAIVNGKNIQLDVEAQIVNDRALVPVRFISEALGGIVVWDQAAKSVIITR